MDHRASSPIETRAASDVSRLRTDGQKSGALTCDKENPVATDKSSIRDKVIDIVCEQMGASRDKITNDTSFINDLGADSLDTVELVMEFEDEFDLNIPDEDAEKIQTVGDAIAYI